MDDDLARSYKAALDMLPPLTRAAFLLAIADRLAYADIAWRCGIDPAEVQLRVADALASIDRARDGCATLAMRRRDALSPWRDAWARYRLRRRHRRLDRPYRVAQAKAAPRDSWHRHFASNIRSLIR